MIEAALVVVFGNDTGMAGFAGYVASHADVPFPLCATTGALFLVVDVPVGRHRQIFMVYAVQQATEIPQLLLDEVVGVLLCRYCESHRLRRMTRVSLFSVAFLWDFAWLVT